MMQMADLETMCARAEVIVLGEIQRLEGGNEKYPVVFIEKQLKGIKVSAEILHLCKMTDDIEDVVEGPGYHPGRVVLFLQHDSHHSCFRTVLGYRGEVRSENNNVKTISITGQPREQSVMQFIKSIKTCPDVIMKNYE